MREAPCKKRESEEEKFGEWRKYMKRRKNEKSIAIIFLLFQIVINVCLYLDAHPVESSDEIRKSASDRES